MRGIGRRRARHTELVAPPAVDGRGRDCPEKAPRRRDYTARIGIGAFLTGSPCPRQAASRSDHSARTVSR